LLPTVSIHNNSECGSSMNYGTDIVLAAESSRSATDTADRGIEGVYIPAVSVISVLLLPPAVGLVLLVRGFGFRASVSTVTVAVLLPAGWLLYFLLLGALKVPSSQ